VHAPVKYANSDSVSCASDADTEPGTETEPESEEDSESEEEEEAPHTAWVSYQKESEPSPTLLEPKHKHTGKEKISCHHILRKKQRNELWTDEELAKEQQDLLTMMFKPGGDRIFVTTQ
jgi:hypothetical protein